MRDQAILIAPLSLAAILSATSKQWSLSLMTGMEILLMLLAAVMVRAHASRFLIT